MSVITQTQTNIRSVAFSKQLGFRKVVTERVTTFLQEHKLPVRDAPAMYLKTAIVIAWWVGTYLLLMLGGFPWYINLGLCASFALAMGAVGFNIMHDANHGGYSDSPVVNKLLSFMLEPLGASSFAWRQTHNVWHHTYTNISGLDDDLETEGMMRMTPHEEWKPRYRFQHWYMPFVYGLTLFGFLIRDVRIYFTGRSTSTKVFPPMKTADKVTFWAGKLAFLTIMLVIPLLVHPWYQVLIGVLFVMVLFGLILASIFQLAHVMPDATFPEPASQPMPADGDPLHIENEWAIHEVETTVNFGPQNKVLNWYAGGLNFQIEHHLFPKISHVHYASIAPIVRATCEEFGVRYNSYTSWIDAIIAHWRSLKWLGQAPTLQPAKATVLKPQVQTSRK